MIKPLSLNIFGAWRLLGLAAGVFSAIFVLVPQASADIVSVQNTGQTCSSVSSGATVACTYNYTAVNGATNPLVIGGSAGSAGLYVLDNNTGATITSLTFTLDEDMAQNQFVNCQFGGGESGTCEVTSSGGGSGSGTTKYVPCPGQSQCNSMESGSFIIPVTTTVTWSGFSVGNGDTFDLSFASWANGATPFTPPTSSTPEPGTLALLATGLFGLIGFSRRKPGV